MEGEREEKDDMSRRESTTHSEYVLRCMLFRSLSIANAVSLNHDGTDGSDGTGIQSVSPDPSASAACPSPPSVPSFSNSRSN